MLRSICGANLGGLGSIPHQLSSRPVAIKMHFWPNLPQGSIRKNYRYLFTRMNIVGNGFHRMTTICIFGSSLIFYLKTWYLDVSTVLGKNGCNTLSEQTVPKYDLSKENQLIAAKIRFSFENMICSKKIFIRFQNMIFLSKE